MSLNFSPIVLMVSTMRLFGTMTLIFLTSLYLDHLGTMTLTH